MFGYGTTGVNDQIIPVAPDQAFHPLVFGNVAEDMWPMVGSYQQPPVMSQFTNYGSVPAYAGGASQGGAYGTVPTNSGPGGSPFHPTGSPLWWALGFLVLSVLGLHFIFWRKGD